jgi:hypothetical protein
MPKKSVTREEVVEILNDALGKDRDAINRLFNHREECGSTLALHPTIQVKGNKDETFFEVGPLGIINGFFGEYRDEPGAIRMVIDEENEEIERFEVS